MHWEFHHRSFMPLDHAHVYFLQSDFVFSAGVRSLVIKQDLTQRLDFLLKLKKRGSIARSILLTPFPNLYSKLILHHEYNNNNHVVIIFSGL